MRVFGGSLGVASSIIVLINKIQTVLGDNLSESQLQDFYRNPLIILTFAPDNATKARDAFIEGFREDMYICIGMSCASFVVSLFTFQRHPPSVKSKLASLEAELAQLNEAAAVV